MGIGSLLPGFARSCRSSELRDLRKGSVSCAPTEHTEPA